MASTPVENGVDHARQNAEGFESYLPRTGMGIILIYDIGHADPRRLETIIFLNNASWYILSFTRSNWDGVRGPTAP